MLASIRCAKTTTYIFVVVCSQGTSRAPDESVVVSAVLNPSPDISNAQEIDPMMSSKAVLGLLSSPSTLVTAEVNIKDSKCITSLALIEVWFAKSLFTPSASFFSIKASLSPTSPWLCFFILVCHSSSQVFWRLPSFRKVVEVTIGKFKMLRVTKFSAGVFLKHHSNGRCLPRGLLGT